MKKQRQKIKNEGIFESLDPKKQDKIIHALIDEFAAEGYDLASTNKVAKRAGIAKGSLFKYFGTKEHMYFHMVEHVMKHYMDMLRSTIPELPKDILQRFKKMQEHTFGYAAQNQVMFRFLMRVMRNNSGEIRQKFMPEIEKLYRELLIGVDMRHLRIGVKEAIKMIQVFDAAMDSEVLSETTHETDIRTIKEKFQKKLDMFYDVLENGIYK